MISWAEPRFYEFTAWERLAYASHQGDVELGRESLRSMGDHVDCEGSWDDIEQLHHDWRLPVLRCLLRGLTMRKLAFSPWIELTGVAYPGETADSFSLQPDR